MKKQSKSEKIRKLLQKGMRQADICRELGVSSQLVCIVARNAGYTKRKPKAKAKSHPKVRLTREQDLMLKVMLLLNEYQKAA